MALYISMKGHRVTISINNHHHPHYPAEFSNDLEATNQNKIQPSAFPDPDGIYSCSITLCSLTPDQDNVLWLPSDQQPDKTVWYCNTEQGNSICLRPFDRTSLINWFKKSSTDPISRNEINNDTLILSTPAEHWGQPKRVQLNEIAPGPRLSRRQIIQTLREARQEGAVPDLRRANLSGIDLWNIDLSSADLRGADFSNANLFMANLYDAKLQGAQFRQANLCEAIFVEAQLEGANLQGANLFLASFLGADLHNANLSKTNMNFANLRKTNLANVNFRDAKLRRADFNKCQSVAGADFSGAQLDLAQHLFDAPDWRDARFSIWQNITLGLPFKQQRELLPIDRPN